MVDLHDTMILDGKARRLSTGELAASVRCARTGLQDYAGYEVGKPEMERVIVYRPETEVMKRDSFASFAGVPVTIDHPPESVTTDNWKKFAVGEAGDEVVRDGEFVRVPILVRDEAAINAIQDGKREISMGYSCSLEFVDGVTPDGKPYQAVQRDIRINHLAVVDRARGGSALVVDDQRVDGQTYTRDGNGHIVPTERSDASSSQSGAPRQDGDRLMATKQIMFDGMPIEATDQAEAAILKLQGQVTSLTDAKAASDTKVGELTATVSSKDGEIAALNKKIEDSVLTPAQLEKMVADRSALIGQAKGIDAKIVTDGMTEAQIRKAAVVSKLGDAAASMDDAAIGGAFAVLAKDVKVDPVRNAITDTPVVVGDAAAEYAASKEKAKAALRDAWRTPAIAA